ncbi:MAG: haloalkane dehalogenase [Rhodobacter sp.]|nr:haloalkane dehalogenase [Rhodobacter sp.]
MTIDALRTPDTCFADLPDWPYAPRYLDDLAGYEGLRIHYIDEGPPEGRTFLCLHGEPTWAYLYRRMIPVFLGSGARVVCPDMLGFGRSDKPVEDATYGFHFHRNMLLALVERLDLTRITLVVQDWGGLLGLTLPMDLPDRIDRLLAMNTTLATGNPAGQGFEDWRAYVAANPDLDVGKLMSRACPHLTPGEVAAYAAPFPDQSYKAGVRRFPQMVMTEPGMEGVETSKRAAHFLANNWQGESFMAIGLADPVLGGPAMRHLHGLIRNCPAPLEIPDGGHFLQEWGAPVAEAALTQWG